LLAEMLPRVADLIGQGDRRIDRGRGAQRGDEGGCSQFDEDFGVDVTVVWC
jgi:hypothetical protein